MKVIICIHPNYDLKNFKIYYEFNVVKFKLNILLIGRL